MITDDLSMVCGSLVETFARDCSAIETDLIETKKTSVWSVLFRLLKIEFVYAKKGSMLCPKSTLYCRVYLQNSSDVCFHLPQIIDMLNLNDFNCYYFPFIENEERMKACFNVISEFLIKNYDKIEALAVSDFDYNAYQINEIKRIGKIKENDIPEDSEEKRIYFQYVQSTVSEYQILHYTTFEAYDYFVRGMYSRSLEKYSKYKKHNELFFYEEKLVKFIEEAKGLEEPFEAVTSECAAMIDVKEYNGTSKADRKTILVSILICLVVLSVPIAIIMALVNLYYSKSTVLCDSVSVLYAPLFAAIPAIFGGLGILNKVQLLFHKNKKQAKDFTELLNTPNTFKVPKILCVIFLAFAIAFYAFAAQPYIRCYDDYFLVNVSDKFFTNEFVKEEYKDIEAVYHVDGRYNPYGEYVGRSSYLLCFDNEIFDTDLFTLSDSQIKNNLLPLFEKYVDIDNIEHIKTQEDIE